MHLIIANKSSLSKNHQILRIQFQRFLRFLEMEVVTYKQCQPLNEKYMDKDTLLLRLNEKWRCSLPFGWIPITGDQDILNVKIFDSNYFDYYTDEVKEIIKSKFQISNLFEIREDGQFKKLYIDDCDFSYDGHEYIYTDENLGFALYFSHESSTTIGGKEFLEELDAIWPEANNHFWVPFQNN